MLFGVDPSVGLSVVSAGTSAINFPSFDKLPLNENTIKSVPELAPLYDRYLKSCHLEKDEFGWNLIAPSSIHLNRIQPYRALLERALNVSLCRLECRRDTRQETSDATGRPNPQAQRQVNHQVQLPLPSRPANLPDLREEERKRRHSVPQLVVSKDLEIVMQMGRRWAVAVNEGAYGQTLWVHGSAGNGKTSLLKQFHSWLDLRFRFEHLDVMKFFSDWRRSLDEGNHLQFVRRFRKETQVLILENIDDLLGKVKTQQEVLYTVTAILDAGGSVLVSSSRHPTELRDSMEPALFSRLFSGMFLQMPKPDRTLKEQLWRKLLADHNMLSYPIEVSVNERLVSLPLDSVRKVHTVLVNAIGRLSVKGTLGNQDLADLEALHAVSPAMRTGTRSSIEIVDEITKLCGLSRASVMGPVRRQSVALVRSFVCLALARFGGLTNVSISSLLEKDPSTVSHALKTLEERIEADRNIAEQWNWICTQMGFPLDAPTIRG